MTTSPGRVASFGLLLGVAVCTAEGTTTNAVGVAQAQAQAQTQAHKTLSRSHTVETTGSSSRVEPAVLDSINKHKDMVEAHYEGEDFFYDNQGETQNLAAVHKGDAALLETSQETQTRASDGTAQEVRAYAEASSERYHDRGNELQKAFDQGMRFAQRKHHHKHHQHNYDAQRQQQEEQNMFLKNPLQMFQMQQQQTMQILQQEEQQREAFKARAAQQQMPLANQQTQQVQQIQAQQLQQPQQIQQLINQDGGQNTRFRQKNRQMRNQEVVNQINVSGPQPQLQQPQQPQSQNQPLQQPGQQSTNSFGSNTRFRQTLNTNQQAAIATANGAGSNLQQTAQMGVGANVGAGASTGTGAGAQYGLNDPGGFGYGYGGGYLVGGPGGGIQRNANMLGYQQNVPYWSTPLEPMYNNLMQLPTSTNWAFYSDGQRHPQNTRIYDHYNHKSGNTGLLDLGEDDEGA